MSAPAGQATGRMSAARIAVAGFIGTAIVARPVGAVVFGHFGDRIGRRTTALCIYLLHETRTADLDDEGAFTR